MALMLEMIAICRLWALRLRLLGLCMQQLSRQALRCRYALWSRQEPGHNKDACCSVAYQAPHPVLHSAGQFPSPIPLCGFWFRLASSSLRQMPACNWQRLQLGRISVSASHKGCCDLASAADLAAGPMVSWVQCHNNGCTCSRLHWTLGCLRWTPQGISAFNLGHV